MANKKIFTAQYRRKREGRTDYKSRLVILKSKLPRLVIRKSNKHMLVQLIQYGEQGDIIIKSAHSKELAKYGWELSTGNTPAAYLTGLLIGSRTKGQEAITDIGLQAPIKGSKIFAVVKGAADAGLKIKFSEEVVPKEDRVFGKHIEEYVKTLSKEDKKSVKLQESFEKAKQKILSE